MIRAFAEATQSGLAADARATFVTLPAWGGSLFRPTHLYLEINASVFGVPVARIRTNIEGLAGLNRDLAHTNDPFCLPLYGTIKPGAGGTIDLENVSGGTLSALRLGLFGYWLDDPDFDPRPRTRGLSWTGGTEGTAVSVGSTTEALVYRGRAPNVEHGIVLSMMAWRQASELQGMTFRFEGEGCGFLKPFTMGPKGWAPLSIYLPALTEFRIYARKSALSSTMQLQLWGHQPVGYVAKR